MKLLLDSANIDLVKMIATTSAIDGVTTNPSLMAKEQKGDYHDKLLEIGRVLCQSGQKKHLSAEVITLDPGEMYVQSSEIICKFKEAGLLSLLDLYIKIPVTLANLSVISNLENSGIKINATACMTHGQAKMALDAGASIVSYFYNRMRDGGNTVPGTELIKTSNYIYDHDDTRLHDAKIICGSIRKSEDVFECWNAGSHYVTASMRVIESMLRHPETDKAINGFQKDIEQWLK